jgi:hypothetical protein
MPWESIGSVDTGEMPDEEDWIVFCLSMAKSYIEFVCENDSYDGKLDIMWSDHDLGNYPSLGVWYEMEEPCEYIRACEHALDVFNDSVSWLNLKNHYFKSRDLTDEEDGDDEDERGLLPMCLMGERFESD